jgi:GSH-dependent disulfide-bond oxidoreductase
MIDLYFSPTPNGLKLRLFLEEAGLPYTIKPVRLSAGEQFAPAYLAISPGGKMPAIVDHDPVDGGEPLPVFESGAIMLYLAERHHVLLSPDRRARGEATQWLFWQVSQLGPMAGQAGYFRVYAPKPVPEAIERYTAQLHTLYGVLDRRLQGRSFIAGEAYSLADAACYPWIVPHAAHGQSLLDFPSLARWFRGIAARPATQRVYEGVVDVYSRPGAPVAAQGAVS